jgi:serine/threonine-protein kinase RsbW
VVTLTLHTLGDLPLAQRSADQLIADHNIDADAAYALRLAIEELGSNVIRHGFDDRNVHDIFLRIDVVPGAIEFVLEDDGRPFDPSKPRHLETPGSLEMAPTGGMGLSLVAEIAGPIEYQRINARNRTTLRIRTQAS